MGRFEGLAMQIIYKREVLKKNFTNTFAYEIEFPGEGVREEVWIHSIDSGGS